MSNHDRMSVPGEDNYWQSDNTYMSKYKITRFIDVY